MRRSINIMLALALLATVSCGTSGDSALRDDGRLEQTAYENEVEVMTLEMKDFHRQLLTNGIVHARTRAGMVFTTAGVLSSVKVSNGDHVSKGQRIAEVNRPDLVLSLREAENSMSKAEFDLLDFLAGQGYYGSDTTGVSKEVMSMARMRSGYNAARISLARIRNEVAGTQLVAPFSGRVAGISLKSYDQASTSQVFCTILDDSVLDVDFKVMESEYSFLEKGLTVKISPYADITKAYYGKISEINPVVESNGQISVRAQMYNDGALLDGMNVKVMVERTVSGQLVVPKSAVVIRDDMDVLFTYTDDGKAHWTYVNVLQSNSDSYVVSANADRGAALQVGDHVIVSGNLNLADGSEVVLKK